MDIELKGAFQDGGVFYVDDDACLLPVIADYRDMVHGDHDMTGAEAARRRFAIEFPEFIAA